MKTNMIKMSEVASRAGVSQTTVSFVLGGRADRGRISNETRERVLNVAHEMGYQRNQLARAVVTGKSHILGVLTSLESGEVIAKVLAGAMQIASDDDYLLKVVHLSNGDIDDATINRCLKWNLAGAMVIGLSNKSILRVSQEFSAKQLPVAMIDNAPAADWGMRIRSDDGQGIRQIVDHLVSLGHTRIAFVGGRPSPLSDWREASFLGASSAHGLSIPAKWIKQTSWGNEEIIEQGVREMFQESGSRYPTAVACSGDAIAMIVQRVALSLGLRLPQDLSVTGYSNAELSSFANPSLTTIDQSFSEMGYAAAQHLIEATQDSQLTRSYGAFPDLLTATRLIVRKSTDVAPML